MSKWLPDGAASRVLVTVAFTWAVHCVFENVVELAGTLRSTGELRLPWHYEAPFIVAAFLLASWLCWREGTDDVKA